MSFPTKNFKCCELEDKCHDDHEIEVTCVKKEDPTQIDVRTGKPFKTHVYLFSAKIGDVVYEHGMGIGSDDGENLIVPTSEQLQLDVDACRRFAARHAHARHVVKEFEGQIK